MFYGFISTTTFNPSNSQNDTLVMGVSLVIGIFVSFSTDTTTGNGYSIFLFMEDMIWFRRKGTTFRTNVRNTVREERSELSETLSDQ